MRMFKPLLSPLAWLIGGVVIGGFVGWSGVLCAGGSCAITGSWPGGAVMGGFAGLAIAGRGCPSCAFLPRADASDDEPSKTET